MPSHLLDVSEAGGIRLPESWCRNLSGSIASHLLQVGVRPSELKGRLNVVEEILYAARDLSLTDRAILLAIAEQESHFNPLARNRNSSASGVFQIISATWKGLGMNGKDPFKYQHNIEAGVSLYRENLGILGRRRGISLMPAERLIEMYVLHHDGPSGVDLGGRRLAVNRVLPRFNHWLKILNENTSCGVITEKGSNQLSSAIK